jgi:hypothetical protein
VVKLPEHATVYVVVPGVEDLPLAMIHSPHLLRPEQAADFAMEIVEGEDTPCDDRLLFPLRRYGRRVSYLQSGTTIPADVKRKDAAAVCVSRF